jgi:hypothetical protein
MKRALLILITASLSVSAYAQVFGTIRGTVVDQQTRPIPSALIVIRSSVSAYTQQTTTNETGVFTLSAVPAGPYSMDVERSGFQRISQGLTVTTGGAPVLNFTMVVAGVTASVEVTEQLDVSNSSVSSPPISVDEREIQNTPGATRANSIAFITNYVPGAFLLHDHLHVKGGHQVSWLIDGVPIPNTNLSSNIGRQLDPKDIQNVEISTGGYSSRYGDRTYGVVNIVPRSGFEFDGREAELRLNYGSFNQTNNQLSFGGHSEGFAYYASASGNRTDLGLEPPEKDVIHNTGNGTSGFTSLSYNAGTRDLIRATGQLRRDHYWVPNTAADQQRGIRDVNGERDGFATLSWAHTFGPRVMLTVAPFYHYNRAKYDGGPNDPLITTDDRLSRYVGAQTILSVVHGKHNLSTGVSAFRQHDDRTFGLQLTGGRGTSARESQSLAGHLLSSFVEEQFRPVEWFTVNAGLRLTRYSATISEAATNPRVGATIRIPRLNWILRSFWGSFYQAPPLAAIGGPVKEFAVSEGFDLLPLKGERDQQREFGLTIPMRNWMLSVSQFFTNAENFSDHEVLGNSNIALPLSIQTVRSRGQEFTLHSPEFKRRIRMHLAYANMIVQGRGGITAGLTDFAPPDEGYFYIDHDQRHTLSFGGEVQLPSHVWLNGNLSAGSGFLDGNGPEHLPKHGTLDLAAGKSLSDKISITFTALNIFNTRFLLGRENAFAGTHYNDPRQLSVQIRYRFHL